MAKTFFPPFRTGDVVQYIGRDKDWRGEHIIHKVVVNGLNNYKYSTTQGAWIPHKNFNLLREANSDSIKKLLKEIDEEADSYFE